MPAGLDATLVLVRHGESEYIAEGRFQGRAETPLSALGLEQAALVARRLGSPGSPPALPVPSGDPLELVHSPLRRTTQTAAAIAEVLGETIPRRAAAEFIEVGQGAWEGLHRDEVIARFPDVLAGWRRSPTTTVPPGGEMLAAVQARVRAGLGPILTRLADASGRPVGGPSWPGVHYGPAFRSPVAGYGGPIEATPWTILVGHDGVFKVLLLTLFDLPLERFWMWTMDLCALTVIDLRAGRPILRAANLTEHLRPAASVGAEERLLRRQRSGAL